LREPYLVGPLCDQFLRRGRCLRLGRTDHGSGGSRNGRCFDKAPGAGSVKGGSDWVCSHNSMFSEFYAF
jgi:hypothetical protein